jgi:integrase/recombinase XerD
MRGSCAPSYLARGFFLENVMSENVETHPNEIHLVWRWLEIKQHNEGRSPITCALYRGHIFGLRHFLQERGKDLLEASTEDLEHYAGQHQHQKKVRPISRRVVVTAIRGFYQFLADKKVLADSPARSLPMPAAGSPLPLAMPLHYAEQLLMQPGLGDFIAIRNTAIIGVLVGTGCRASGICNLNEGDFAIDPDSAGSHRRKLLLREKGKKERWVPLPFEISLLVEAYLGCPELQEIDRTTKHGDKVLFVSMAHPRLGAHDHYGERRRLGPWSIHWIVKKTAKAAGIPDQYAHPHALRHLFGAELAEEDVDLLTRQSLLGHADPATTEIYSHLATRKLRKVVEKAGPVAKMKTTPMRGIERRLQR